MNEKFCISIPISLIFFPKGPMDNKISIGSVNALAPNRRQAITQTNADPVQWRIHDMLGEDELIEHIVIGGGPDFGNLSLFRLLHDMMTS